MFSDVIFLTNQLNKFQLVSGAFLNRSFSKSIFLPKYVLDCLWSFQQRYCRYGAVREQKTFMKNFFPQQSAWILRSPPPHFLTSLLDRKGGRMSFGYGCPLHSQSSVYARWWSYTSPSLASVLPRPPALPLSPLYLVHLLVGELNLSTSACSLACFAGDKDVISQTPCWLYFPYCTYDWFLQIGV